MVRVFTKQGCGPCATLKYWLNKQQINYEEIKYEESPELFPAGFVSAPVTEIGGQYVMGPNFSTIKRLLNLT